MFSAGKAATAGAFSTATTIKKIATGEIAEDVAPPNKLMEFLTTLVTYPGLYIFATATAASPPNPAAIAGAAIAPAPRLGEPGATAKLPGPGARDLLESTTEIVSPLALAPEAKYRLSDFPEGRALVVLERWCRTPVFLGWLDELLAKAREYGRGLAEWAQAPWALNLRTYLDSFPEASPGLSLEDVVDLSLRQAREDAAAEGGGTTALPLRRLASAVSPNLAHIARQLQQRHRLARGRTWLEFSQIFLGLFQIWLSLVSAAFGWASAGLRLLGSLCQMASGAVAFTVVISIVLSIISGILFFSGAAAGAISSLLGRLASYTEVMAHGSKRGDVRHQLEGDLVGPRSLAPSSFEELEDLFLSQLAPRLRLRSRPDAARLANDPLLLRAYDLRLVDGSGNVIAEDEDAVGDCFEAGGFFGLAPAAVRKAGGLLLLRLLSWKRIGTLMSSGEALKYVFVLGREAAGKTTTFAALTHLPKDYKEAPFVSAEIRPVQRLHGAYAVTVPGLKSQDPAVAARAAHIADLSHGVVSVVMYVVSCEEVPHPDLLSPQLWQAVAARRPVLLLANKAIKMTETIMSDPRVVEELKAGWQAVLYEAAARRGLEADGVTVMVAEMRDVPPPGVAGPQQVRDWLDTVAAALQR